MGCNGVYIYTRTCEHDQEFSDSTRAQPPPPPSNSLLPFLGGGSDVVSVSCFGVRVSVMFHFMFVHYTFFSPVLAICSHCILSICNIYLVPVLVLRAEIAF